MFPAAAIKIWRRWRDMSEREASSMVATRSSEQLKASRRISTRFAELAKKGELGIVAYVTAGDPSLEASEKIVLAATDAGADGIETGVPFSEAFAGGPGC